MNKFLREDNFKYIKKHSIDYGRIKTIQFIEKVDKFKEERKLKNKLKELELKKLQKNGEINWNLRSKDELYQSKFKRNPFDLKDNSTNKFNFKKHKEQIEFADRNMTKNRLNHALNQIALHFVKVKSKINIKGDIFNEIKNAIKNNIKKTQTISKKKSLFLKTSTSLNFDDNNYNNKEKEKKNIINNNNNNNENNNENEINQLLIEDNNSSSISNDDESSKLYENLQPNKKRNLIFKIIPPTHGKNYYFIKKLGKFPISSANTRIETDYTLNIYPKNNVFKSYNYGNKNKKKFKIKNNPFYTTNIDDFIKDYHQINNKINKEKKDFIKRKFHDYDELEEMMNIRKELKLFQLKDKFINSNFSKPKKVKVNNKNRLFNTIYTYCQNHEIDYI